MYSSFLKGVLKIGTFLSWTIYQKCVITGCIFRNMEYQNSFSCHLTGHFGCFQGFVWSLIIFLGSNFNNNMLVIYCYVRNHPKLANYYMTQKQQPWFLWVKNLYRRQQGNLCPCHGKPGAGLTWCLPYSAGAVSRNPYMSLLKWPGLPHNMVVKIQGQGKGIVFRSSGCWNKVPHICPLITLALRDLKWILSGEHQGVGVMCCFWKLQSRLWLLSFFSF